jgi:hypothetical protein
MRADDYLTAEEKRQVAEAGLTGTGLAMLAACRRERARIADGLGGESRIGSERIEDDVRFHLGVMRGLEFLARLRGCARRELGMTPDDDDGE